MKFDGFRALAWVGDDGVRLQSRHGKDLTRFFPEITATIAEHLPTGVVLDGEILVWDEAKGRTSFTLLQRRLTAGRRVAQVAAATPAHFVAFDLLRDAAGVREPPAIPASRPLPGGCRPVRSVFSVVRWSELTP